VIFVTGLCPRKCFYCPLSRTRRRDILLVNEIRVSRIEDIVREVALTGAEGAGLTGGDPLVRLERTARIIEVLKTEFGDDFHIHLYTSGMTLTREVIERLISVGLDEIRLHPPANIVDRLVEMLKQYAKQLSIGFETPAFPGRSNDIVKLAMKLEASSLHFLNINELEFSETNYMALIQRGYSLSEDYITAQGSREAALQALRLCSQRRLNVTLHFCPASSKDRFQTGLRLYRRAIITAKPYELVTDYGTLVFIEGLKALVDIPSCLLSWHKGRVRTSLHFADFIEDALLVEELGSADRLRVYEAPLKDTHARH